MKTIKIFIASSNELEKERLLMASLANELSTRLEKVGIQVIAVEWESLDASMGEPHKQEEYNEKLRECDMCMVLYWTKFGMYTKTELDTAYHEKIAGKNPQKVWVYFKEKESPDKQPTEELNEFRDSFPTKYGHFYTPFANFDTLKAHFLLQFMEYQSQALQGKSIVEVKDGKVTVDGKEYVDLQNVPFAGNNEEYNDLIKDIEELQEDLEDMSPDSPRYARKAEKLLKSKEKLSKMESSLWDTALMITKFSTTKCSERLKRAMDLFTAGDNKGAQAVLNEEEIEKDIQHYLNLIRLGEEGKKGLEVNIQEYHLRINAIRNECSFDEYVHLYNIFLFLKNLVEEHNFFSLEIYYCFEEILKCFVEDTFDSDLSLQAMEIAQCKLNNTKQFLSSDHKLLADSFVDLGLCEKDNEYPDKAFTHFDSALELYTENGFAKECVETTLIKAYYHLELGNYERGLQLFTSLLPDEEIIEKSKRVRLFSGIADCYMSMKMYDLATKFYTQALHINENIEIRRRLLIKTGDSFNNQKQYDKAIEFYLSGLDLYKKKEERLQIMRTPGVIYHKIGQTYLQLGKIEKAIEYYNAALARYYGKKRENLKSELELLLK